MPSKAQGGIHIVPVDRGIAVHVHPVRPETTWRGSRRSCIGCRVHQLQPPTIPWLGEGEGSGRERNQFNCNALWHSGGPFITFVNSQCQESHSHPHILGHHWVACILLLGAVRWSAMPKTRIIARNKITFLLSHSFFSCIIFLLSHTMGVVCATAAGPNPSGTAWH